MFIGTPLTDQATRLLLLGGGELGKELAIELIRLGVEVIACDRYGNAPAMQVAQRSWVVDLLDGDALEELIRKEQPHLIVPETEAVASDRLLLLEMEGFVTVPNAEALRLTRNREILRRMASEELDLPTARFRFADTLDELGTAAQEVGWPVVVKPIISSNGQGQSLARSVEDLATAWDYAQRGGIASRVMIEEFIDFENEITLLTVRTREATLFCDPIGYHHKAGEYIESWQPHPMSILQLQQSKTIARAVCDRLGGWGLFAVKLFLHRDGRVLFSEVNPRPHDTGLVTLATQTLSEFALHARAMLNLPIPMIPRHSIGASVAVIAADGPIVHPHYEGVDAAMKEAGVDVRIFGKPEAAPGHRMALCLAQGRNVQEALAKAKAARDKIRITEA